MDRALEILETLECCSIGVSGDTKNCGECPRSGGDEPCVSLLKDAAETIRALTAKLEQTEHLLDAAINDIKESDGECCEVCEHNAEYLDCDCNCAECETVCGCYRCRKADKFKWRGSGDKQ